MKGMKKKDSKATLCPQTMSKSLTHKLTDVVAKSEWNSSVS